MNIVFSLVLYKHSTDDIMPLLSSIQKLYNGTESISVYLSIYNACPSKEKDPSPSLFRSFLADSLIHYEYGKNIGFGAANNRNFNSARRQMDEFLFVVVNPDISFEPMSLIPLLEWVLSSGNISCAAPLVLNPGGAVQFSAKKNPTLLSLLIGRLPFLARIPLLGKYDHWHRNLEKDYRQECIMSTYLSGCFLIIPSRHYSIVGGFSEAYFLHLEDADIVRRLSMVGQCLHNPIGTVVHQWARGSHRSPVQMFHLCHSFLVYSANWGFAMI